MVEINYEGVKRMSFTIKCDKCGNTQTFKDFNSMWKQIEVVVNTSTRGYSGETNIDDITFYCENSECNNSVDVKY